MKNYTSFKGSVVSLFGSLYHNTSSNPNADLRQPLQAYYGLKNTSPASEALRDTSLGGESKVSGDEGKFERLERYFMMERMKDPKKGWDRVRVWTSMECRKTRKVRRGVEGSGREEIQAEKTPKAPVSCTERGKQNNNAASLARPGASQPLYYLCSAIN